MVEREISSTYRSNPILQRIRSKESEELDLIQQACTITEKGFRRVLSWNQCDGVRNRSWIYSWIHAQSL
jgi:Xaa-Pro aminopeptidase